MDPTICATSCWFLMIAKPEQNMLRDISSVWRAWGKSRHSHVEEMLGNRN
jgi:hypothetical protein